MPKAEKALNLRDLELRPEVFSEVDGVEPDWDEGSDAFLRKYFEPHPNTISSIAGYLDVPVFEVYARARHLELTTLAYGDIFKVYGPKD